jgi:hypothetical protein
LKGLFPDDEISASPTMTQAQEKYFDPFPLHMISRTSPVKSMNGE